MTDTEQTTLHDIVQERYGQAGRAKGPAKPHRPKRPCQHDGCDGWAWARGYCDHHYQKLKREGVIRVVRKNIGDPVARFRASYAVNPATGCWEWTGWIHPKGYGILSLGRKSKKIRAHRFSWELHRGPVPDGLLVLHKCDNRRCCCPDHLFLGTNSDNIRDCVAKGRHHAKPGVAPTKLTPAMAQNIRLMHARGLALGRQNPYSTQKLADTYRVDQSTIAGVVKGRSHLAE